MGIEQHAVRVSLIRFPIWLMSLSAVVSSSASAQSEVTRITPSTIQLQAGGTPLQVTFDGQRLSERTTVRVLNGSQPVDGLTAVLQQRPEFIGAGRMIVVFSAAQTVPAGTYKLEMMAEGRPVRLPGDPPIIVIRQLPQRVNPTEGLPANPPRAAGTVEVAPSIASATPMTLAIRVGGPTQTVTFTGSRLNIITDAYVERSSGQRVNGVRVELQSSTDARRRDIRFTALANAGPPWGDALRLVLEYRVGVMPMSLRPALQITAAAPANVDLSVSSCTFQTTRSAPGTRVQVVATIQNMGSAGLSFQTGQLIARVVPHFQQFSASLPVPGQPAPPAPAPFQTFPAEGGGRYIAPGGTASVTASFNAISTATSYEVTWTVDPDDVVPESNANNNERRCAYTPPPPVTPDLQISGIATQPQSGPPQTTFVFTVTVSGAGIQRYSPYAILDVRCLIDGAAFTGGSFAVPNSVRQHPNAASGSISYTHEIRTTRSFAVGSHVLECIVDPEQALNPAEATRANNARSLLFNVTSN